VYAGLRYATLAAGCNGGRRDRVRRRSRNTERTPYIRGSGLSARRQGGHGKLQIILIHFKNDLFFGVFLDISRRFLGILRSVATLMPENAALYLKNASEFIGHFIKELVL